MRVDMIKLLLIIKCGLLLSVQEVFSMEIAHYKSATTVVNENNIDRDQKIINDSLVPGIPGGFDQALSVYEKGGHSYPKAKVDISPELSNMLTKGDVVEGITTIGEEIVGTVYHDYDIGSTSIEIEYGLRYDPDHSGLVKCQVGGNPNPVTDDCFKSSGHILVSGDTILQYSYDVNSPDDNKFNEYIKWFSMSTRKQQFECDTVKHNTCPYDDITKFNSYYGKLDYADIWVTAAAEGDKTIGFDNGDADFSQLNEDGRKEAFKRGTVYLHFFMQVIGEMEKALDDCNAEDSQLDGKHRWDRAVAFYTGSLEGSTGSSEGVLMYRWANKMCKEFKTCGLKSDESKATSFVNHQIITHFKDGLDSLDKSDCDQAKWARDRIVELMLVPLVQVVMYESHARSVGRDDGARSYGAGGAAVAALLPYLHRCNVDDAEFLYDQMRVDRFAEIDFPGVKTTLERNYDCLNIHCQEVGGVYDDETKSYYTGANPCNAKEKLKKKHKNNSSSSSGNDNSLAIGLGVGAALLVLIVVMIASFVGVQPAPHPSGLSAEQGGEMT